MIHSRYCSGDSDNGGCDCDGVILAGICPLPFVQQGMVVRDPHGAVYRVIQIYDDGDSFGKSWTWISLESRRLGLVHQEQSTKVREWTLAEDFDTHPAASEAAALAALDREEAR